jgi:uracil-DNA glycosylase family protein
MKHILLQPTFEAWRVAARQSLHAGLAPHQIDLQDATAPQPLSLEPETADPPASTPIFRPVTSKTFLDLATQAAAHRDPSRWNLLYRILFRLQSDPQLLTAEHDPDIIQLQHLAAQVHRDLTSMLAFLRLVKILGPGDPSFAAGRPTVLDEPLIQTDPNQPDPHHLLLAIPTPFGLTRTEIEPCEPAPALPSPDEPCDHFVAWYAPEHRILPLAAPLFAEKFNILHWTILTPDQSASWNPITHRLTFGPGVPLDAPPSDEELETLWRRHRETTRLESTMPVSPPEPPALTLEAPSTPMTTRPAKPSADPFIPSDHTLPSLAAALPTCRGCDLYKHASHAVPGRGQPTSALLLVGEQPGDQEDLQALPFVGPAGKLLDHILEELHLDRSTLFVTNAVKHFKFVQRGKLRLHQPPLISEINACRPWLLAEIDAVQPRVILCLGASAAKSVFGNTFSLMRDRGQLLPSPYAPQAIATIHPSAILRARDEASREELTALFKQDLTLAHQAATNPSQP